jgi:glycosyltransferase involved in cell wall biosynthesis
MEQLLTQSSNLNIAIWGHESWGARGELLARAYRGFPVFGLEYAKAIQLSKINLGLLYEGNTDCTEPDVITARSFEIPAAGGFMLHERTQVAEEYFEDGKECIFFDDLDDMIDKIRYYLDHDQERQAIALAGRKRCLESGYSTDVRSEVIIAKYHELREQRDCILKD